jgi:hypothetical protein
MNASEMSDLLAGIDHACEWFAECATTGQWWNAERLADKAFRYADRLERAVSDDRNS